MGPRIGIALQRGGIVDRLRRFTDFKMMKWLTFLVFVAGVTVLSIWMGAVAEGYLE